MGPLTLTLTQGGSPPSPPTPPAAPLGSCIPPNLPAFPVSSLGRTPAGPASSWPSPCFSTAPPLVASATHPQLGPPSPAAWRTLEVGRWGKDAGAAASRQRRSAPWGSGTGGFLSDRWRGNVRVRGDKCAECAVKVRVSSCPTAIAPLVFPGWSPDPPGPGPLSRVMRQTPPPPRAPPPGGGGRGQGHQGRPGVAADGGFLHLVLCSHMAVCTGYRNPSPAPARH